jgi:sugar phosphate isomerase/epimerase
MPLLSLAHFTVIEANPLELIDCAAVAGFDAVGMRIVAPPGAAPIMPVIGDFALQRAITAKLSASGIILLDVEAIWLTPETKVDSFAAVLDTAAALGARHLIASGNDSDKTRMADHLAQLCEEACRRGLRVMLEFLPYTQIRTLAEAHELLCLIGPADAGLLVDALHLSRSGGSPADIAAYDPTLFSLIHLCDALSQPPLPEEFRAEARGGRLLPGDGGLWLEAFLLAFSAETAVAVEAPSVQLARMSPGLRAKAAAAAGRALLTRLGS